MYQVYKIENMINHQVYIGSTTDINTRWRHHQYCAFNPNDHHYNYPLMKAFREFGVENFQFSIIETLNSFQDMITAEQQWIIKENCVYPNGYNQTVRTDSPMFDPIISKKMSQTKREKYGKKVGEILNNKVIQTWDSLAEAAEITGLDRFKISAVCNGKRLTTGNRIFRFLDENNNIIEPNISTDNKSTINRVTKSSKQVVKLDDDNNILQTYESIAIAAKKNKCDASGIAKVCNGKRNKCGGFKWQYLKKQ